MESERVNGSFSFSGGDDNSAAFSFTENFYEQLPYYLAIGMTNDEFWNGDVRLTECYRKSHELKTRKKNQELWLQGAYFYEALCDVAPALQAFAKRPKIEPYVKEPFPVTKSEIEEREEIKKKTEYETIKTKMRLWAANTNAKFGLKGSEENGRNN